MLFCSLLRNYVAINCCSETFKKYEHCQCDLQPLHLRMTMLVSSTNQIAAFVSVCKRIYTKIDYDYKAPSLLGLFYVHLNIFSTQVLSWIFHFVKEKLHWWNTDLFSCTSSNQVLMSVLSNSHFSATRKPNLTYLPCLTKAINQASTFCCCLYYLFNRSGHNNG